MSDAALEKALSDLDQAREEILQLQSLFHGDETSILQMREVFDATPQQARILHALITRKYVSYDYMDTIAGEVWRRADRELPSRHFAVQISKLRKKVQPHGIDISNLYGFGYSMSLESRTRIKELLDDDSAEGIDA